MKGHDLRQLGEPDLAFGPFHVWILGRQFEDSQDYWDGNWLRSIVHCSSGASDAWADGSILHLSELALWLEDLEKVNGTAEGVAELSCIEPNVWARLELGRTGNGQLKIKLTQDHMKELHEFSVDVDQSYLPGVVSSLRAVLTKYPLIGGIVRSSGLAGCHQGQPCERSAGGAVVKSS